MLNISIIVAIAGLAELPSPETLKNAAAVQRGSIQSFVLKAHAIEAQMQVIPPGVEEETKKGISPLFTMPAEQAATRPARARESLGRRYRVELAQGGRRLTFLRERMKPSPIDLVVSCDLAVPFLVKQVIDRRDLAEVRRPLGLAATEREIISLTQTDIFTRDGYVGFFPEYNRATRAKGGPRPVDEQALCMWLGVLPRAVFEREGLVIRADDASARVVVSVAAGASTRIEWVTDPAAAYRVTRYAVLDLQKNYTAQSWEFNDYRKVGDDVMVPFKIHHRRAMDDIPDVYALDCVVDEFKLNPVIDRSILRLPDDVRMDDLPQ